MCVILDTNLADEVFRASPGSVPSEFFRWMSSRQCRLVVGGQLRRELEHVNAYLRWSRIALRAGRLRQEDDEVIDERTRELKLGNACRSDDAHVIALAQISGARVLYSDDRALRDDFTDTALLRPRGRLLPLGGTRNASRARQRLLAEPDLCPEARVTR